MPSKKLLLLACLLPSAGLMAQPDRELKKYQLLYPDEHAVILKEQNVLDVSMVQGTPEIVLNRMVEYMYLDNLAGQFMEQSVEYSMMDKITNIEAATYTPGPSRYKETKVKDFTYRDKLSESVFYDGGKSVSFLYPALQPGSKSSLRYSRKLSEPRLLPSVFLQKGSPVLESEFSVITGPEVEVDCKLFNLPDSLYTFEKITLKNNRIHYLWKFKNIKKYKSEEDAPGPAYFSPHIIPKIKSYQVNGARYPVLSSVDDLYKWYYGLTQKINKSANKELNQVVDSLIVPGDSEREKVKKIFYWVQDHIKYVAFEDGMGGFIPRNSEEVCHKRYGDCKDMATLLQSMLSYAGVPSYLTWIGSRRIPYTYEELPCPAVDDHMICTYADQGSYYFLDATGQFIPFGLPTSFIQGKEALIGISDKNYKIIKVPVIEASGNKRMDSVNISIQGAALTGNGVAVLTGFEKINWTHALSGNDKNDQKVLRGFLSKGSNKFIIRNFTLRHLQDKDLPLHVDYDFIVEDYLRSYGSQTYVNMHLNRELLSSVIPPERTLPVEREFKGQHVYVTVLEIPKGYQVTYLPENSSFQSDLFGYTIVYEKKGNKIILTEKFDFNVLLLQKDDFGKWNSMIQKLKKAYAEVLIINKI